MANNNQDTHRYSLDSDIADQMLQNILCKCDIEPNDIPLNRLQVRHKADNASTNIVKLISLILFVMTLLSPLAFPKPNTRMIVESSAMENLNMIDYSSNKEYISITLNSYFHVSLSDSYLKTVNGESFSIDEYHENTNTVLFPQTNCESIIYLYTQNGTVLQLHFYPTN